MALAVWALTALAFAGPAGAAPPPQGVTSLELTGTIGPYRVGANLTIQDNVQVIAGHYFYATKLTDIPLTGHTDGEEVTLNEPGGGVFQLHFTTNASTTERPLNFYNSTALEGTWTLGKTSLPVKLGFSYSAPPEGPYYSDVTTEPDAAFEARAQRFLHGALTGDRAEAAAAVSYPLTVNAKRTITIRDKAALIAHWNAIFTPKYLALLKAAIPHEMFVHENQAMVGNGEVWFDAKGATVLNLPD
jgi:hypothetical protein